MPSTSSRSRRSVSSQDPVANAATDFASDISNASSALERIAAKEKKQSKAKSKVLWTRASAYAANRMPDRALADAQKALKLSLEDPRAYVRAAKLLTESHCHAQAMEYLDIAEQKLEHCTPSRKGKLARKVENQRRLVALKICDISRLPDEILLLIFQHVPSLSIPISLCRKWRHVILSAPSMWRHLKLSQGLTEAQCIDALDTYTFRSNKSLESVEMPRNFFRFSTKPLVAILRQSAATLRHLKMPSLDQRICYEELYRHCPNLKSLDVNTETADPFDGLNDGPIEMPLFPQTGVCPLQLEVFKGDPNISYLLPISSMNKLRVVHYLDPPCEEGAGGPDPAKSMDYLKAIVKLADDLEELAILHPSHVANTVCHLDDGSLTLNIDDQIEFKKLKVLRGWTITRPACIFAFPALEEAKLSCNDTLGWMDVLELPLLFSDTPFIRKLDLDMGDIDPRDAESFITAIGRLEHLQDLTLEHYNWRDIKFEDILAPTYEWDRAEQACLPFVPCPRLTRLAFTETEIRLTYLIRVLAMRNYLAMGHTFQVARDLAQKHYGQPELIKAWNPFRRESTPTPSWTADDSLQIVPGAQARRFDVCRLQTFELLQVKSRDGMFEHFDDFADRVNIRYKLH